MLQSPRAQHQQHQTLPLSPRALARSGSSSAASSGGGGLRRGPSQRQMLEMAFEGESSPELDDTELNAELAVSPRSSSVSRLSGSGSRSGFNGARHYAASNPRVARLSLDESRRSSGGSWHEISGVMAPTTPSYAMMHEAALPSEDDSLIVERADPELFQAGILEHAQRLGIDPYSESELLWVARDSLVAPLPEHWVYQETTSTRAPYYYNVVTGVSQWEHPSDHAFLQKVQEERQRIYGGGSEHLSSSEDLQTASFYEQHHGYGDGSTAAAWQEEYDTSSSDYQHSGHWEGESAHDGGNEYYQGYDMQSTSATGSSSRGYEETSEVDVADSHSMLVASGRRQHVRGSGAESPSHVVLEALKTQLQELEKKNKELEDQCNRDASLILKLEGKVKFLEEQAITQPSQKDGDTVPRSEKDDLEAVVADLEAVVADLRTGLDGSKARINELEEVIEEQQKKLDSISTVQTEDQNIVTEVQSSRDFEIMELREQAAEEKARVKQLEDELTSCRQQIAGVTDELSGARSVIKNLEWDLIQHAQKEQNEAEAAATEAAKRCAAAEEKISDMETQLDERDEQLNAGQSAIAALKRDIEAMRIEHFRSLDLVKTEHQESLFKRDADLGVKDTELQSLRGSASVAAVEKAELQIKLDKQIQVAAMQQAEAEDQQRALKRDIRALERDLKALQSVSKEREDEFAGAKRVIASLQQKLHEQDQIVEEAKLAAREEAKKAAAELVRQIQAEKAHVAELYSLELRTRRKLHNQLMELQGNIRVFCRVRPIQAVELKSEQSSPAVFFRSNDPESLDLVVGGELGPDGKLLNGAGQKHPFEFDHVFQPTSSQVQVFEETKALVTSALDGFNVCIFAYGQTGSGKTHTMEGSDADQGLYYRSLEKLFKIREQRTAAGDFECTMKLSMLEVYNESIVDLLDNTPPPTGLDQRKGLEARMGKQGVYVDNLIEVEVYNEKDVTDLMKLGKSHRSVGAHDFNEHSSRSHLVLSITIETVQKNENKRRVSKLHLIDLAGSERVSKTAASGQRLKEAQNINRSLSALGDVISALATNSKHVPYRNSKLTFLLQESLSGNSKVLMFVNVSPVQWNAPETLCSLNFASRCRNVALGMAKPSGSNDTSSSSPSLSKEQPARSANSVTTASSSKQRPPAPSPSVKNSQRVVFG